MSKKIYILGSAFPFRGGLSAFNERLAKQFQDEGHEVKILTFSLQYPKILFPGKTQYSSGETPKSLTIERCVNSINPLNWLKIGRRIRKEKPDLLIIKYWIPFMAPCFGTIARLAKRNKHTKVVSIVDNMIPHEKHFYDTPLSKYFVKPIDAFVAMSQSVKNDIQKFSQKPCILSPHPMFDNFGHAISRDEALLNMNLSKDFRYLLYFGFIRHYKGLDLLFEAFADERLKKLPVKLIVSGEFYEDSKPYFDLIEKYNLHDRLILKTDFVPDNEVANYFCAADLVALPYRDATQSGVTQIAYHFTKPMLVTNVGGLAELVPDGKSGYVVIPNPQAIADALVDFFETKNPEYFTQTLNEQRKRFEWNTMTTAILNSQFSILN
ncbi:MAG: glycosyltransferase [Bacteroidales bacterium]|jgi:glycosyltransferase involved in cell wall biosynthesis|nr:glycosyltransferase [Bacteroidales bacterium]